MQSLLLNFLKVTESAAIAAIPWVGSGDENAADGAATNEMRKTLNKMKMNGTVVIGEGEIDEAPMLYIGERLGIGGNHEVDIAVDPIEGTTPTVNGQGNAITVIAAAKKGTLLHAPDMYMKKIAVGPKAKGKVHLDAPIEENIRVVAEATGKKVQDIHILIQDRPRHKEYINRIRQTGAKVHLFNEGDVIYSAATCIEGLGIDMFFGIGGAPEGVLGAVAVRCLGGEMQAKLLPRNDEERNRCREMGITDVDSVLTHEQLVATDDCAFVATGITDNLLVKGIETEDANYVTHSILINGLEKQLRYVKSTYPILANV
ncbi:class II fructose-bisphosphatase [Oceanobacillus sp. FSL H7-0719]|uniref:class II fructose-bisphosphatase n=1 Tax=Oceanobacillus sp. FSL H7-0719 TaxID=2954507 RepID=UPI00324AE87B